MALHRRKAGGGRRKNGRATSAFRLPPSVWSLQELTTVVGGRHRPWWQRLLPRGLAHEGVVLEQHIREGRFQRSLALVAGLSSLPSGFEVAYEHYRGSYSGTPRKPTALAVG